MLFLARYAMQGPTQAWMTLAALSLLTVWFSPVGLLAGALVALITLQVGEKEGTQAMLIASATMVAASMMTSGAYSMGLILAVEFAASGWLFARVLRRSQDLGVAILAVTSAVALIVTAFHVMVDDPVSWWRSAFEQVFAMMDRKPELSAGQWEQMAQLATVMVGVSLVMLWTSMVMLARWWQSALYHPGRFQADFHALRLPRQLGWILGLLALAGLVLQGQQSGAQLLVSNLFAVTSAALMFQGLAVFHALVKQRQMSVAWLVALYGLLLLIPQMIFFLALVALFDMWFDIRRRYATPSK